MRAAHRARGELERSLLIKAELLQRAEQVCRRLVGKVRVVDAATLLLDAEPAWAGAINTVLVKKGVTIGELSALHRRTPEAPNTQRKETEHMDDYYDLDPSNRRYSEEELQQIRERYLLKQEAEDGWRSGQGRLGSAWKALLALLTKQ